MVRGVRGVTTIRGGGGQRVRPPLDKELFPVHRPSGLKRADWNFSFQIFIFFFFNFPTLYILVYKKNQLGKKTKSRPTDWPFFC